MSVELELRSPASADGMPLVGNCFDRRCPTRAVLAHVTGRWGSLVLAALRDSAVLRFSELRKRIDGISEKMLAQTLRELEHDGLIIRVSRPVVPPYVDYRLSELGEGVAGHVEALIRWIETNARALIAARQGTDHLVCALPDSEREPPAM